MNDLLPPSPEPTARDYAAAAFKAGVSAIPGWGGPTAELFGMITAPILSRRHDNWLEGLRLRLNQVSMQVDGLTIESLMQNEMFVSALTQAIQSALKTHQVEKLAALRNAVVNVALGKEPVADRQTIFLTLIERFTPLHLMLLQFFADPVGHCAKKGIKADNPPACWQQQALGTLLNSSFEGLNNQVRSPQNGRDAAGWQFLDVVLAELVAANLTRISTVAKSPPTYLPWTTHLGADFLEFITLPSTHATFNRR